MRALAARGHRQGPQYTAPWPRWCQLRCVLRTTDPDARLPERHRDRETWLGVLAVGENWLGLGFSSPPCEGSVFQCLLSSFSSFSFSSSSLSPLSPSQQKSLAWESQLGGLTFWTASTSWPKTWECISVWADRASKSANVTSLCVHRLRKSWKNTACWLSEREKVRMYQRFAAFWLIEPQKVRMYQRFCSSNFEKCECISVFPHRTSKSANVAAFLLIKVQT